MGIDAGSGPVGVAHGRLPSYGLGGWLPVGPGQVQLVSRIAVSCLVRWGGVSAGSGPVGFAHRGSPVLGGGTGIDAGSGSFDVAAASHLSSGPVGGLPVRPGQVQLVSRIAVSCLVRWGGVSA